MYCFSLTEKVLFSSRTSTAVSLNLRKKITFFVVMICGRTLWFWLLVEGSFSSLDQLSKCRGSLSLLSWYVSPLCELMWIIISFLRNGPTDMIAIDIFSNSQGPCYLFFFCPSCDLTWWIVLKEISFELFSPMFFCLHRNARAYICWSAWIILYVLCRYSHAEMYKDV